MTYTDALIQYINDTKVGTPIFTADLAEMLSKEFDLDLKKANAAVSVALMRIIRGNRCPFLRFYQKGIYYNTAVTPFGECDINKEKLIQRKYLHKNAGYDTDYFAMYRLGLTTQLPNKRVIASNNANGCLRNDKRLEVYVRPPKTTVTAENWQYLQLLDILGLMKKAPIDTDEPYKLLTKYIDKAGLNYQKLIGLAYQFYSRTVIIELAQIASAV